MKTAFTIFTKYLAPTNTKGSRIKAQSASAGYSVTVAWDHSLGVVENHQMAAQKILDQVDLDGEMVRGSMPDNSKWSFVFAII